ncbi:MAG TPA: energy transducer TonB [Ohtaekwangia sp.]
MERNEGLSDDELSQYMDFDQLLAKRNKVILKRKFIIGSVVLGVGLIILMTLLYVQNQPLTPVNEVRDAEQDQPGNSPVDPDSDQTSSSGLGTELNVKDTSFIEKEKPGNPLVKKDSSSGKSRKQSTEPEQVYLPAEPREGYPNLYSYFNANLVYPVNAIPDSIQGTLVISFVINKEGKPEEIHFSNSLGEAFESEASRLVSTMPAWNPATLNGKPMRSKVSLPLTFELKKIQSKK